MDGQKSQTSKVINACFSFSGIALHHSMVLLVLFHRFTLVAWMTSLFMRSRMFLLMAPISDLLGLMSLQDGLQSGSKCRKIKSRGKLILKASHWSRYVEGTFVNMKDVVGNFVTRTGTIHGGLKHKLLAGNCDHVT